MGTDFYIATGSIALAFCLYTWLMLYNLKVLRETKQERLEARRKERAARKNLFTFPL